MVIDPFTPPNFRGLALAGFAERMAAGRAPLATFGTLRAGF
jgi:hypothetical protein